MKTVLILIILIMPPWECCYTCCQDLKNMTYNRGRVLASPCPS